MSLLLDRETIRGLITMPEAMDLLEKAFAELVDGSAVMPPRTAVSDPDTLVIHILHINCEVWMTRLFDRAFAIRRLAGAPLS